MFIRIFLFIVSLFIVNCSLSEKEESMMEEMSLNPDSTVVVNEVQVSGSMNSYSFSVSMQSPDKGCDQYADWWEITDLPGNLIFRRNLSHSHVNEQPFTRSGSPVQIKETDSIIVRGHMNNIGYGRKGMKGTVIGGFKSILLDLNFASELEKSSPLPPKCAF